MVRETSQIRFIEVTYKQENMEILFKKHRLIFRFSILLFLMLFLSGSPFLTGCTRSSASIIVAGSTSVQPFAEVLAEEFMILNPDVVIDIQGGGSAAGIMATNSGTADIGMSSRKLKDDEKNLWSIEIARDGLAVIVHPDNPINSLGLEQVRGIYSGTIDNWQSIGGTKSPIHIFTREEGSGTRSSFESLVMNSTEIMAGAMVQDSNGAVRQLVGDDPAAIGFISLGLVDRTVKALELDGITPTAENILNGTYHLSRSFLFLTYSEPEGIVKEFIDFSVSEKGRGLLNAEGLVTQEVKLK